MEHYTECEEYYRDEAYYADDVEPREDVTGCNPAEYEELDGGDPYDCEYDGQPDEMQEWHDFDPDC